MSKTITELINNVKSGVSDADTKLENFVENLENDLEELH